MAREKLKMDPAFREEVRRLRKQNKAVFVDSDGNVAAVPLRRGRKKKSR